MACRGRLDQDKAAQEASRSLLQESWCKAEAEGKGVKREGRGERVVQKREDSAVRVSKAKIWLCYPLMPLRASSQFFCALVSTFIKWGLS